MENTFKAPQKTLRSSWISASFSKPKKGGVLIKKSLSSRARPIFSNKGELTTLSKDYSY